MRKMLTDKQIQALEGLDRETQFEILHICAESLGLVSVKEYQEATGRNRRTIYDWMNSGKIKYLKVSDHKLPLVNLF